MSELAALSMLIFPLGLVLGVLVAVASSSASDGDHMADDRQFRVSGDWALASDGIQWIVQKWAGNRWRGLKYIRSDKAWLAYRLTTLGVPAADAANLLADLPDTFDAWAAQSVAGQPEEPLAPKSPNAWGTP